VVGFEDARGFEFRIPYSVGCLVTNKRSPEGLAEDGGGNDMKGDATLGVEYS
jgi:hypothetical protein